MLLTIVVWCYMYARRIPFIMRNELLPEQLTPSELHSAVHCTFNLVPLRFWLYAISVVALWFMVLRTAWSVVF